jgi:hypothetical protein
VLSHAQGEFLFVLDGQSTMAKNDPVATSEVYNLASLNARLREAAEVENRYVADAGDSSNAPRKRGAVRSSSAVHPRTFMTDPSVVASRIKFVGVQVDDTQTSEAKKSLYRKARAALVVCAGEGWCEVANCWGDVAEGTTVGFLLRKFTDPSGRSERRSGASSSSSAGSGSSALDVSPLQLVPVAIQTDTGWASHLNYGSPTVPMPFGSVPSSASEAHRKRQRSLVNLKMERLIDPRASSPSYSRREFVRASTILDCEQMEDRTTTGTIYGFRDKDRSRGPIIDPENISATYFDYDRTLVSRNLDGGKTARLNADSGEIVSGGTWAIYPTSCQGYFFPAGVVIRAARGGNPDVSKIHDCTFDELGFGLTKLRANNKITLQIRLDH